MMNQSLAILLDAFRELQAKKMFWVVLILNILAIGAFGVIGANDHTITVLWFEPLGDLRTSGVVPVLMYKILFSNLVVKYWFTWISTLLALISTASIFPDFLSSGSVDLYLAKPISRLRLFFTKYVAGLLFVTLQVTIFTVLSFLVLGIRAGIWEPGLFAAIPLVVVFFSYIFSICVLLGTTTRSTIAALMLTILCWVGIWAVDTGETLILTFRQANELRAADADDRIEAIDAQIVKVKASDDKSGLESLQQMRDRLAEERKGMEVSPGLKTAEMVAYSIKTLVPKTRETISLLDRVLFKDKDLQDAARHEEDAATRPEFPRRRGGQRFEARQAEQMKTARARPVWWIIGTSLLFEAVCLALAAWHFCTRDF